MVNPIDSNNNWTNLHSQNLLYLLLLDHPGPLSWQGQLCLYIHRSKYAELRSSLLTRLNLLRPKLLQKFTSGSRVQAYFKELILSNWGLYMALFMLRWAPSFIQIKFINRNHSQKTKSKRTAIFPQENVPKEVILWLVGVTFPKNATRESKNLVLFPNSSSRWNNGCRELHILKSWSILQEFVLTFRWLFSNYVI